LQRRYIGIRPADRARHGRDTRQFAEPPEGGNSRLDPPGNDQMVALEAPSIMYKLKLRII
jgi:hypothetical protein